MKARDLKRRRRITNMSRKDLSEALGISWRTLEGYEQGRRPIPAPVEKLADFILDKQPTK